MIDFEEELKKFKPSLEVEEAEEAIYMTTQCPVHRDRTKTETDDNHPHQSL